MKYIVILMFCLVSIQEVDAQSLSLFNVDATNFPKITGKFYAFDASGQQQRPVVGELSILENGIARTITNVTCPPPNPPKALSSVLVIDVSGSMGWGSGTTINMDLAKAAARAWVNGLPLGTSECAITSFDGSNYLNQDFTTDKNKLLNAITPLQPNGGTDYDAALINPMAGGLKISTRGKNLRVIVFLTDGQPWQDPQVAAIVSEANIQNCVIYCVTLGMPAPQSVKDIASGTGGQTFENVTTVKEAEDVYRKILQLAQGGSPCDIIWMSDYACQAGGTVVDLTWQSNKSSSSYVPPASTVVTLQTVPTFIAFGKRLPTTTNDTTITLTAQNADITVTGISRKFGSADFTVVNTTFPLAIPKNTSQTITLRFNPTDSTIKYASFEIETDKCNSYFSATGGFPGKKMTVPTLKLTHPNGGETFVVGSDTVITWTGVAPSDTVWLEYSIDNGATWKILTKLATGLRYVWKNVPLPESNMCLVKVSQSSNGSIERDSVFTLIGHTSGVNDIAFSHDGIRIATASFDSTAIIWDAATGVPLQTFIHTGFVNGVSFSPDGGKIATACYNISANIWDANTGNLLKNITSMGSSVAKVAFSPDGDRVATASGIISGFNLVSPQIWNVNTGSLINSFTGHTKSVVDVTFSSDGSKILSGSIDGTAKLWDANSGTLLRTFTGHTNSLDAIAFSPDGSRIATVSMDNTAKVWDANTGILIRTFSGNIYGDVAFSPDGSSIATAGSDTVNIWDVATGIRIRSLIGHTSIYSVSFSPDGTKLAASYVDNTAKVWNIESPILQEDKSDMIFTIVTPTPSSQDINMQKCMIHNIRDSLVSTFVLNSDMYPFRVDSIAISGADANQFSLVSGVPPFNVLPGASHAVEFRFKPTSVGIKTAQLVVFTQSDTLRQTIQGEGIAPSLAVVSSIIDFGQVDVGKSKDTLRAVTIKNVGTALLSITTTRHARPNDVDFLTITGGGSFTLAQGDTARLDLRFLPTDVGRTSGTLLFDYNGVGSPATVQLFGEGVKRGAQILALGVNIPSFTCEIEKVDTLRVKNSGSDTLRITSATFTGTNPTDFQFVNPFTPTQILPDSTLLLAVKFIPSAIGNRSTILEVRSNSVTDSVLSLSLSGRKEDAAFSSSIQKIDLGILCPNESRDTSLTLTNIGTIRNSLRFQSPNLILGASSLLLGSTESKTLTIRFAGQATTGIVNEILTITDTICGVQKTVQVVGIIQAPKFIPQPLVDFGAVIGGTSSTLDIIAVNKDTRPVTIAAPIGITPPFVLVALTPSAGTILAPNDTVKATIRYDAIEGISSTSKVDWTVLLPCTTTDSTIVLGSGIRPDTTQTIISLRDITAQAGEKVNLVLYIAQQKNMNLPGAPKNFTAKIRYNPTMLFNEQTQNVCVNTDVTDCQIDLTGTLGSGNDLAIIPCVATLGSSDNSSLTLEDFKWTDGTVKSITQTQNGKITITGTCEQGGVRLYIPASNSTSLTTRPNPAQNTLQIQYGLREPLNVTLELLNMTGQVVQTIINNQAQAAGGYLLTADLSLLGNGVYQLRLLTGVETLTSRVDVVK